MNTAASDSHRSKTKDSASASALALSPAPLAFIRIGLGDSDAGSDDGSGRTSPAVGAIAVAGQISDALGPLREVVASLARARTGWFPSATERQRLTRRARRAGLSGLPALLRALTAESDHEAAWAHCLLRGIAAAASPGPLRDRVLERLNQLLGSARPSDQVKARVLALLSDLGAPLSDDVVLRDPDGLLAGSVQELLTSLDGATEVDQAVDLIFTQVPADELPSFLDHVAQHGGAGARPLFAALISDPRLPRELARQYMAQYRPTLRPPQAPQAAPARRRPPRERMLTRLAQALTLLHEGQLVKARGRLTRLLPEFADQPEVHSALGLCLLRLGEPHEALVQLECARLLEPTVAAHDWNHASAAHAAQRLGLCYRSLRSYLQQPDDLEGAAGRRRTAERFCQRYEQATQADATSQLPDHMISN